MEIVKKLESPSTEEDFNFKFEEEYLSPKEDSNKHLFFILIILLLISIAGYLGFQKLQTKSEISTEITKVLTTPKKIDIPNINDKMKATNHHIELPKPNETKKQVVKNELSTEKTKVITAPKKIDIPKTNDKMKATDYHVELPTPNETKKQIVKNEVIKSKVTKEVAVYTEVLAQDILPKSSQKVLKKEPEPDIKITKVIPKKTVSKKAKPRIITIKKGDTLAYISKKFYGTTTEVQRIVDANHDIKNKNSTLGIGQKVYVPK